MREARLLPRFRFIFLMTYCVIGCHCFHSFALGLPARLTLPSICNATDLSHPQCCVHGFKHLRLCVFVVMKVFDSIFVCQPGPAPFRLLLVFQLCSNDGASVRGFLRCSFAVAFARGVAADTFVSAVPARCSPGSDDECYSRYQGGTKPQVQLCG